MGETKPVVAEFEKVIDSKEYTNFDFYLEFENKKRVFFEIKYSESGFGTANPDGKHQEKLENTYKERLAGKVNPKYLDEDMFFKHYQILRNISYLDVSNDDMLVFIYPADNLGLGKELNLEDILAGSKIENNKVKVFTWEEILEKAFLKLNAGRVLPEIHVLLNAFKEKYFGY